MKKLDLERALKDLGYWQVKSKGPHDKWTNGVRTVAVPRHREVKEGTARAILKQAKD